MVVPDGLTIEPSVPITGYRDRFGNQCKRVLAPAGRLRLATDGVVRDGGLPDETMAGAWQDSVQCGGVRCGRVMSCGHLKF